MTDRETRLRERVADLERELEEAKRDRDLHYEVARAAREGCRAAGEEFAKRAEAAERAADAARRAGQAALIEAGDKTEYVGRIYGRLGEVDTQVQAWADRLPPEFVAEVRKHTRPDFAELLGVGR
ncbi:hypothetical protein I0C86_41690 [Plantactinospora sp. S1510]|uniref:Uncharacterized protein n=1 Tax=Plantactinospora alkalitolerans TaxID=2789879 RepID=A0ABS0HA57_9ACTN|nr:hypothetical protein [Plantactinospora alkalitolerans]MBF9135367.1 hypothetical protein [Plantactinospora alkalitolerans]